MNFSVQLDRPSHVWIACLLSATVFWFLNGWLFQGFMGTHDVTSHFLIYRYLYDVNGQFWNATYSPIALGGIHVTGTYSAPLIYVLLSILRIPPLWAINLTQIIIPALVLFFSTRIITPYLNTTKFFILSILLLCQPVLVWRLFFGHQMYLFGLVFLLAVLFTFKVFDKKPNRFDFALLSFALIASLTALTPQLIFVAMIILLLHWLYNLGRPQNPLLISVSAICVAVISVVFLWDSLFLLFSGENARNLNFTAIIDRTWLTWKDVLSSLSYFYYSMDRPGFQHELNYPIGPFLLTLFFVKRRQLLFLIFLMASYWFIVLPQSQELARSIPIFSAFRAPARGLILIYFYFFLISFPIILSSLKNINIWKLDFVLAISTSIVFLAWNIGSIALDIALYISVILIIFLSSPSLKRAGLIILSCCLLLSCWHRNFGHFPSPPEKRIFAEKSIFARQMTYQFNPVVGPNTLHFQEIPSIDGYWLPGRRFIELIKSLNNQAIATISNIYVLQNWSQESDILKNLYSVDGGKTPIFPLYEKVKTHSTWDSLALGLKEKSDDLLHVTENPLALPKDLNCESTSIELLSESMNPFQLHLKTKSSGNCLTVLPTNYSPFFSSNTLVFPAFGALTGVLVPPGENELHIFTKTKLPVTVIIMGFLSLLILILLARRLREN